MVQGSAVLGLLLLFFLPLWPSSECGGFCSVVWGLGFFLALWAALAGAAGGLVSCALSSHAFCSSFTVDNEVREDGSAPRSNLVGK